jgi:integrase
MQPTPEKWPRIIKRGGSEVKIYQIRNRGRVAYQCAYWIAGRRVLKNFARFTAAHAHAEEQATFLNSGKFAVASMHDHDREAYTTAIRMLKPLETPLVEAVRAFVAASKEIDGRGSLVQAAREFRERHTSRLPDKTVADVVGEFLAAKEQDDASYLYLKTLRSQLAPTNNDATDGRERRRRNSFADAFHVNIADIRAKEIDDWIRGRGVGARTRRNITLSIRTLFTYAKARGYLPKNEPTEADEVLIPKNKGGQIGILTAAQLHTLLLGTKEHTATAEHRLWLALGAFSGLRTEELKRLEWKSVSLASGYIEVTAKNAKTGARRLVPILPNLAAWLAPHAANSGPVFPRDRAEERVRAYAGRLGAEWPHNALRHSFATYRLATIHDTPRVALEMGNSPAIVMKHYRELATEAEGKAWFAITSAKPANVIAMKGAAA